jgi:hypothetical protein
MAVPMVRPGGHSQPGWNCVKTIGMAMAGGIMDKDVPRAHHDLGGVAKFMCEPVDIEPHGLTDFDREVDALRQMLAAKKLMSVDELRRGIEAIPEAE